MGKRVVVLAGHGSSLPSVARLAALCTLPETTASVVGVVSVSSLSMKRILQWHRRFGFGIVRRALGELGLLAKGQHSEEYKAFQNHLASHGIQQRRLTSFCRKRNIPHVTVRDINDTHAIAQIQALQPDLGIYSGAGILRKPVIDAFPQGVLNLHCGPLPLLRGMNAVEWSLYLGLQPEVTLHWIDTGIDTGAVLASREVPVLRHDTLGAVRARAVLAGIELLTKELPRLDHIEARHNPKNGGRQFYGMCEPLRQQVERWLASGTTPIMRGQCHGGVS